MTDVMEQGSRFLRDLGNAANRNPLSAALIGMGVLWMFAGRSGTRTARALLGRASDTAGETLGRASDMAGRSFDAAGSAISSGASAARRAMGESAETMQRRAADVFDAASQSGRQQMRALSEVSDYGDSIPDKGPGRLQDFGNNLTDFGNNLTDLFRRQPLALGAIGAAIGVSIAAALPLTDTEAQYLGEAGETVKERAGRAMDAAREEARRQGLTTEGVKAAADEMSSKVGRVVGAAKEGVARQSESDGSANNPANLGPVL